METTLSGAAALTAAMHCQARGDIRSRAAAAAALALSIPHHDNARRTGIQPRSRLIHCQKGGQGEGREGQQPCGKTDEGQACVKLRVR